MQPEAQKASTKPKGPLEWGQVNFLHTTDTHGWLEGHLKEKNYGADWGDFASFTKNMKQRAREYGRDLLLVDTGDLHDGNGLSDATSPNGAVTNPIFENIDYDLLTIGNHELYVSEIAYETFSNFSKAYGKKYLTSNVEIINPSTGQFEYIGAKYGYFTTEHGIRIMAFGVLFDFTGNSNVSRVTKAADLVKQQWFLDAVNTPKPVDLYLVIGHNPVRRNVSSSTFGLLHDTIRKLKPNTPLQFFGGHTHVRDFTVYDDKSTGLESGRYCETLGWLAIDGVKPSKRYRRLPGVPEPTTPAKVINTTTASTNAADRHRPKPYPNGEVLYARRYLDWNRLTFEYHSRQRRFDSQKGVAITKDITAERKALNLTALYGCAPQTWCQSCQPFGSSGNIFSLLETALSTVVVNQTRANIPRLIIINTGSLRFDLPEGPFTYDDSFIVSPFSDAFQFIPNVPYQYASKVIGILNAGAFQKREAELSYKDFGFQSMAMLEQDACIDPLIAQGALDSRSPSGGRIIRRQSTALAPGYTTTDDFGAGGDDTPHSKIPYYPQPNDLQANASFPTDGSTPDTVDLIFLDFIASYITNALTKAGSPRKYTTADISYYLPPSFTTNSYLPAYAKVAPDWQKNVPNCPVGTGIGS
ncbi:hypothetical protein FH972_025472 [Carpinus fangiana]|uniref:Uncharacterized protein n=1 Tax=Carpinus fangiana TaxID=176857 RepID=A0A5N6L1J0_9ROSI|nr:hypothetical protein FH972_025472 [Carpinus fangiana]